MEQLNEADMAADPITQFQSWMAAAVAAGLPRPDAMALATATPDGRPSVRMILLKGCDARGFTFFTNYRSRKGRELAANSHAALVFYWPELERQVRIEGAVTCVSAKESAAYFKTRPLDSRLSAVASPQSEVLNDRRQLQRVVEQISQEFPDGDVPCPEYWGGYRLEPAVIEFWQGRPGRLHDRLRYRRADAWILERLAP
jgi:pyridoxamine 5'-phosphate oxidase